MNGKRFGDVVKRLTMDTFAMNPVPQLFKPMLDVYANQDGYTGRPIEKMNMERLAKSERHTNQTSEIGKFLGLAGDVTNLSPVQIDHLVKGYFGWLGTSVLSATDMLTRPLLDRPDRPSATIKDIPVVGNFAETTPGHSSRYMTQLYKQAKEIEEAYATYHQMIKEGDAVGAREYAVQNKEKLAMKEVASSAKKTVAKLNEQSKIIERNRSMTPEAKRGALDNLDVMKNRVAKQASSRIFEVTGR